MEHNDLIGFDNEKYLREQTASILERVNRFNDKLYIEFGGKILFDYHAARVLPGFDPNVKMRLLQILKDKIDVILCINAGDIERKKIRADFGITYDSDALKMIINDAVISDASRQEIIRRYFRCAVEYVMGIIDKETLNRAEQIMSKVGATAEDRQVVLPARKAARDAEAGGKGNAGIFCGAAVELPDGTIITGKNSQLQHAASSLILNATKYLAGLPQNMYLLPKNLIDSVTYLKKDILNGKMVSLDVEETLILLGISALSNPAAQMALENLKFLRNCEVHLTHIPTPGDEAGLRKLKVNVTCDPEFSSKSLFISG